jgi:DNA-directed RNA polymerase specialized sigma24 family protein
MLSDRAAAEDVLQTVWLWWFDLVQLREPERLAAWLYGIARRTVADQSAKHRRPPADQIGEIPDFDDGLELFRRSMR